MMAYGRGPQNRSEAWGEIRADYSAARDNRFRRKRRGIPSMGAHADYHYSDEPSYLRMIEIARDMDRNDLIVGQMVNRSVDNTLQGGFDLHPETGDSGLDLALWERWNEWAKDPDQCDVQGENTFTQLARLAFRHSLIDGDIWALPTKSGAIQLVEAHCIRTPRNTERNVVHGVLLDDKRERVEVWVTKEALSPMRSLERVSDVTRYPIRDAHGYRQVFQVYNPKRATQTRGITALAPIFDALGMWEDINFAMLVQRQSASNWGIFFEKDAKLDVLSPSARGGVGAGATREELNHDGTTKWIEQQGPGMHLRLPPGVKASAFSPNIPNPEFFPHAKLVLTMIGINLGQPLVVLLMDASETNFSGFRGALEQAKMGWCENQRMMDQRFYRPAYVWKVRQWIADDTAFRALVNRGKVKPYSHSWAPPKWPYIQPLDDAAADLMRVRNVLISPRRLHSENSQDFDTIVDETVADNSSAIVKAIVAADAINKEHPGHDIRWRDVLSLPMADGMTVKVGAAPELSQPKVSRETQGAQNA